MLRKEVMACGVLLVASQVLAQATQPAADPAVKALETFIQVAKTGDSEKVAPLLLKLETGSSRNESDQILDAVKAGFFAKATITVHPGKMIDDVAVMPTEIRLPGRRPEVEGTYAVRTGDKWVILFLSSDYQVAKNLSAEQKKRIDDLRAWYDSDEQKERRAAFGKTNPADDQKLQLQRRLGAAIASGDEAAIRKVVSEGADLNSDTGRNRLPIIVAADRKTPELLKLLIELGADVNPKATFDSPLAIAVTADARENVALLMEKGAKADVIDPKGDSPLSKAVALGRTELVKLMLQQGDRADDAKRHLPLLHSAILSGNWDTFELIRPLYADLSIKNQYGGNGLNMAGAVSSTSYKDRARIAAFLLDAGVDPHLVMKGWMTEPGIDTPLRMALNNQPAVADLLLDRVKYDVKELTACVSLAASWSPPATLTKLIEKGAVVKDTVKHGLYSTPLHRAIRFRSEEKVKILLDAGHPVEVAIEFKKRTPLHQAVVQGNVEIVELLLKHRADRSVKDADGNDAIALAKIRVENGREFERGDKITYLPEFTERPDEAANIQNALKAKSE